MDRPRIIGLLGGMSWPSTISYYRALNLGAQRTLGGSHSARILIWSEDYAEVEALQLAQRWDEAGELLADGARRLAAGGAEVLGIACNTMHLVSDAVRSAVTRPLVDMVEVTAVEASKRGARQAAILGTDFTLRAGMYETALAHAGIVPMLPGEAHRRVVDDLIYSELCLGRFTAQARETLQGIVSALVHDGADTVVLACTELGEALGGANRIDGVNGAGGLDVRIIDAADVHIHALLDQSIPLTHRG